MTTILVASVVAVVCSAAGMVYGWKCGYDAGQADADCGWYHCWPWRQEVRR